MTEKKDSTKIPLTRADLIKGKDNVREEFIEELGGYVKLRPLTSAEWETLKGMKLKGVHIETDAQRIYKNGGKPIIDINMERTSLANFEADVFAVSLCLIDDEGPWTVEDVKAMSPANAVDLISKRLYEISGIKEGNVVEQMNTFRPDKRR